MIFKRASANDVKRMFEHIRDKFSEISSGAASTLLGQNLTAKKVLVSDADGKVSASETDADEIAYFYGSIDEVNAALEAGELEAGANIYCEDDTEFEPNFNITEDRAVITNAEGEFAPSDVTAQELEYLSGVTAPVQGQIDEMKSVINIPTNDFFESVAEGVVIESITIKLCGNIVSMYGYFCINSGPNQPIFTIAEKYRGILPYNIFSIRQGNDPFPEKATAFLQSSSGAVTVYFGNNFIASRYYINSMYAI